MTKIFSNNKSIFYMINIFLIILYLYPGSLLGLIIYDDIKLDEYQLEFWCQTAWCPPNELLQHIADKYKVTVECFYEIEGYGDEGVGKDTFHPDLEEAKI